MKLKSVLTGSAAAVALMAASTANASGYYVSVFGGISTMDQEFNVNSRSTGFTGSSFSTGPNLGAFLGTTSFYGGTLGSTTGYQYSVTGYYTFHYFTGTNNWDDQFESGYVIGASLGWDFGTGWRSEFEVAMRKNDIDGGAQEHININYFSKYASYTGTVTYATFGTGSTAVNVTVSNTNTNGAPLLTSNYNTSIGIATEGDLTTWSFMANLWYDFDLGDSKIHPFIGGGIGLAQVDLEYTAHAYTMFGSSYTYNGGDDDWGFAYQLGAGLGFEFDNGMMLTAQYRYFATGEVQAGIRDEPSFNVESQNFLIGLTFPIGGGM